MQIQGLYEYGIGTARREEMERYWGEFGYRVVAEGRLEAGSAQKLYGINSGLTSFRLQNGASEDHGLIRLMLWEQALEPGLGLARPLTVGSRWLTARTQDIVYLRDAFMDGVRAGERWLVSDLVRQIIREGQESEGFYRRFVGVREMMVVGLETRQVFFQRYGYDVPGYGTIDRHSPLQVSEATHGGVVVANLDHLDFYSEVLGLKLEKREKAAPATPALHPETVLRGTVSEIGPLMRAEGESYEYATLVTPETQVGRLYLIAAQNPEPDLQSRSRPGVSGISLATYRVKPIEEFYERVKQSKARKVSPLMPDEFGQPAFSFVAPDGVFWVLAGF